MSGPIVRKYGFPNFDQIFGKKELEHGQDEPETPAEAPLDSTDSKAKSEAPATAPSDRDESKAK
ncbi:MAG: hypothetical protein U0794_14790 [Isosphaeraceae bacterium]